MDLPSQDSACASGVSGGIANIHESLLSKIPCEAMRRTPIRAARICIRVAIVGAASLMGKEVAEVLRDRNFPAVDMRLLDDDEALGQLEAVGDEMNFIQGIRAEQFETWTSPFSLSDRGCARISWEPARPGHHHRSVGRAGRRAGSEIRAPWIERETGQVDNSAAATGPGGGGAPGGYGAGDAGVAGQKAAKDAPGMSRP